MDQNEIRGYLHFTIRDGHLKMPYAYYEPQHLPDVIQYIYLIMYEHKLSMLTVFHPSLVDYFEKHSTPFIYLRAIRRHYIISKVLDAHFTDRDQLMIQDGDADCAFT
jgi:hypothetical protein